MTNILTQIQFNGYSYQSTIDWPATFTDGLQAKLRTSDPPNTDGGFTAGGLLGARKPSIKGTLTVPGTGVLQTDLLSLRNAWDNFKAVHAPGQPAKLFLDSDRYLLAEVASLSDKEWNGLLYRDYEVQFHCADPFWYQASAYAPASNTSAVNVGGASPLTVDTSNGLTAPVSAPVLTAAAGPTALGAGTYTVAYSYVTQYGETVLSPTASVVLTATQKINVAAITLPTGAVSANLYLSIAAGSSTLAYGGNTTGAGVALTALPASGSNTVTTAGNAYSLPILTFVVITSPSGGRITVTNQLGQTFTILPDGTGTFIVDCTPSQETVSVGATDKTSLFAGAFPRLAVGANTVTVGIAGGIALSSASIQWQDRWW